MYSLTPAIHTTTFSETTLMGSAMQQLSVFVVDDDLEVCKFLHTFLVSDLFGDY